MDTPADPPTSTMSLTPVGPSKLSLTARPSDITTSVVALAGVSFNDIQSDNEKIYFACSDPAKQGTAVVQSLSLSQPNPFTISEEAHNVRSAVHEYGGGAFCVFPGGLGVIYTNFPNHTVFWKKDTSEPAQQIFPAANTSSTSRMANFRVVETASKEPFLIAVLEDHANPSPTHVVNSLVRLSLDGSGTVETLASGKDFYTSPVVCQESSRLAFVAWDHPNMPWDRTTVYVLDLDPETLLPATGAAPTPVHGYDAGSGLVSVYAPQWYNGQLYFLSDETGYHNLYRWRAGSDSGDEALYTQPADFSESKCGWILGCQCYTFLENGTLVAVYIPPKTGTDNIFGGDDEPGSKLVLITQDGSVQEFGRSCLPPMSIDSLTACGDTLFFLGGSTTNPPALWCWERPGDGLCVAHEVLSSMKSVKNLAALQQYFSQPTTIQFPSDCGVGYAYGYFYPPCNVSKHLPASFQPPLLVKAHGGPTARTSTTFRLDIQFWTSRGFAVLDVDYAGSTGYGKDFQQSLQGKWGLLDVDDVSKGAQYCVDEGWVNPDWLCIDGRSAGGYTTLAALAFKDVFQAGASLYGIGDLSALYTGTHKMESRYMDGLIGPYPEMKAVYDERCPINYTDKFNCPVILLQGDEDKVVPADQAEKMFEVLNARGFPSALVIYKGEQHGFRKSENISHALLSEYYFFCETFGIKAQAEKNFGGIEIGQRIEV